MYDDIADAVRGKMADTNEKVLIKGLSETMSRARKAIADARNAPAKLEGAAAALTATCNDLTDQVEKMNDDLRFEATQLGNAPPDSESK